jgi:hypothetical protein
MRTRLLERGSRLSLAGIPAAGLAALPNCPACYPLYAGLLSSLGLAALAEPRAQALLTLAFLVVALAALGFRASRRRGWRPLAVGGLASIAIVVGKFALGSGALTYAGVALLVAASLSNAWPTRGQPQAACGACATEAGRPRA